GVGRHPAPGARLVRLGHVAVLEVPATDAVEQGRGGRQYRCRCSLLWSLPGGTVVAAQPVELFVGHIALQVGADAARVEGVDEDAVAGPAAGRLHGEQDVGRLGLAVGGPGLVWTASEVDV